MPAPNNCKLCPLHKARTQVVNGHGPAHAKIVGVGEAPGEVEDRQNRIFIGPTGQVLRKYMHRVGINPESVYWLNVNRCRPPGNRTPKAAEIDACRPFLIEDIRRVKPNLILAFGVPALNTLYGKGTMTKMRGNLLRQLDTGIKMLATWHPSAVSREWNREPEILADLEKAREEAKTPDMPLGETEVVALTELEHVRWLRDWLFKEAPTLDYLSVDVETTGLNYLKDEMLAIGFTPVRGEDFWGMGYSVPILGQEATDYWGDDIQEVLDIVQEILGGPFSFTGQNFKFDQKFLERKPGETSGLYPDVYTAFGFQIRRLEGDRTALGFDTMLAYHLLHEERPHSLDHQRTLFTTMPYYEEQIEAQTTGKTKMANAVPEDLWQYLGGDTDCTGRLTVVHERALAKQPKLRWLLDNIALPLHDFTRRMELRGVLIHRGRFDKLCKEYGKKITAAELDVFRHHPPFNYNSPQQMRQVLFKDLKLPRPNIKTKGAKGCDECRSGYCEEHDSTGAEALKAIKQVKNHPILDDLIVLKELAKLKGTYLDGTGGKSRGMLEHLAPDGRIHCNNQIPGTETGRLATKSPNLQNIPKQKAFRALIIPPPGCLILESDWSQLELRIMALVSGDETLIGLLESGVDVHTYVARKLWPNVDPGLSDEEWGVANEELRRRAKGFNFGLDYGLTAHTVARRFNMSEKEAEEKIAMYMRLFPGLPRYFHERRRELARTGGTETVFGRRRRAHGLQTFRNTRSYRYQIGHIQRQHYNFPIQSPGSDNHSIASCMLDQDEWLLEPLPVPGGMHERACTVLSVHDSVVMEAVAEDVDDPRIIETARYVKEHMEAIPKELLGWNLPVELKWGDSWGSFTREMTPSGEVKAIAA